MRQRTGLSLRLLWMSRILQNLSILYNNFFRTVYGRLDKRFQPFSQPRFALPHGIKPRPRERMARRKDGTAVLIRQG